MNQNSKDESERGRRIWLSYGAYVRLNFMRCIFRDNLSVHPQPSCGLLPLRQCPQYSPRSSSHRCVRGTCAQARCRVYCDKALSRPSCGYHERTLQDQSLHAGRASGSGCPPRECESAFPAMEPPDVIQLDIALLFIEE